MNRPSHAASHLRLVPAAGSPPPGDDSRRRAIARAIWTDIHWLMPVGRTVTITVDGNVINVSFGPKLRLVHSQPNGNEERAPMKLLTPEIETTLRENANQRDVDHEPAVKFFNPCGGGTWLFSELGEDGDTLFGLCDLGFGCPELGYASLREIEAVDGPLGLGIERDLYFEAKTPLTVYADAARVAGHIVQGGPELDAAIARHKAEKERESVSTQPGS